VKLVSISGRRKRINLNVKSRWLILAALIALFTFSTVMLILTQYGYISARREYDELREIAFSPKASPNNENNTGESEVPLDNTDAQQGGDSTPNGSDATTQDDIIINHDALEEINPDYIGWISIEGTAIDYPVVRCRNNSKYIYTTFSGENNNAGAIFLDSLCKTGFGGYAMLHGHNMDDGSMFKDLHKYLNSNFLDENPEIIIFIPSGERLTYRIFDVKLTNINDSLYSLRGTSKQVRDSHFSRYDIEEDADILVLSTCTSSANRNERLLVVAVREGQ